MMKSQAPSGETPLRIADRAPRQSGGQRRRRQDQGLRLAQFWIDHARDAACGVASDARILYVNNAACRSLGYTRDELLTMRVYDVDAGFSGESWAAHWQNIKQHGSITWESEHRTKGGRLFPVQIVADFLEYEGEEYIFGLAHDISERKQHEQALRESQEALRASEVRYRTLAENSYDVICLFSADGHVLYTSPSIKRVLGYEPEERIGTQGLDIVHPDDVDASMAVFEKSRQAPGTPVQYVCRLRHKDGTYRTVEITGTNLLHEPGFHAMVSIFRDITEQRQAEEALRQSKEDLRQAYADVERQVRRRTEELAAANRQLQAENDFRSAVVNRAAEGLCVCHEIDEFPFVRFTVWSDRMTEITGYTMDQINRLGWYQTVYPDEAVRAAVIERMAAMRRGNDLRGEQWVITRADGEQRTLLISTSVLDAGDGPANVLAVMHDITERMRMEQAVRDSEAKLAGVLNAVTDHVSMLDREHNIVWCNGVARQFFGPDIREKKCCQAYQPGGVPCQPCVASKTFADGEKHETETTLSTLQGRRTFWCTANVAVRDDDGQPGLVVTVLRDITDRKRAEEALRGAERLATVGTLAAGIAHEINNPLGAITLSSEIAMAAVNQSDNEGLLKETLDNIQVSARRCSQIVQGVHQFARNKELEKSPGDLGDVIRHARNAAGKLAREQDVRIEIRLDTDLPQLAMASAEMTQVLTNLIVNAVQASPPGSRVTVRAQAASDSVQVLVEDRGCGMGAEELDRIFDPFYTTRCQQGGTGLGLSISHGIVREHGGTIHAQSTPGEGTTMRVVLPLPRGKT
jgi:PAS domain S-box-containing protein